ncbi:TPA: hypothetical protein ACOD92_000187 [Stenotrophomonas maltophilia]
MEESKTVVVYRLITSRLVDTRQAYAISKALNLALGEDSPRRLTDRLSRLEDVTLPILWSCQLATFVGLVAVLEDSKGSASIPELARLIRADGTEVPTELEAEAAVIYEKYRVFRNKLFSHNSTQREQHRELFDEAKISWDQLDADFDAVTRIFKPELGALTQALNKALTEGIQRGQLTGQAMTELSAGFQEILNVPNSQLIWSYFNKGTHDEEDREDFEIQAARQTYAALDRIARALQE